MVQCQCLIIPSRQPSLAKHLTSTHTVTCPCPGLHNRKAKAFSRFTLQFILGVGGDPSRVERFHVVRNKHKFRIQYVMYIHAAYFVTYVGNEK